ncbi:GNAT family N-acetyltransferase [Microtetraspora sp. NBRC 16547]|uniref:GNAT family N-acetyltransferase n=1 Tax=Microtetraspora sp. NBRC 16547 TaxID=3030993 RepID=UPI0024A010D3|nr:GNAT family N-acetyltransferase [Microtetraspora sp. NBRC 16547]GLW96554.1 N-acetyltransferase [Microtetraspora sp. NBRC 16547]
MHPLKVRRATRDDVALLAELNRFVQNVHAAHRPDLFKEQPPIDELISGFEDQLNRESVRIFIAELAEGQAVGYAMATLHQRLAGALMHAGSFVVLEHVAVDPDVARRGIGTALLDAVREAGREAGCTRFMTEVWDFNSRALAFFEASGFAPAWRRLDQPL